MATAIHNMDGKLIIFHPVDLTLCLTYVLSNGRIM